MWIVRFALRRPHTFVIIALLIVLVGVIPSKKSPGAINLRSVH